MFDYRYHALSLVAVFLALAIGLLLGVAIGDEGLVSSAESQLRADLRANVGEAREEARAARQELEQRDEYERETYPALVGQRLQGRRVAVVLVGDTDPRTYSDVRDALAPSGAELASALRLRLPPDLPQLAEASAGTRYQRLTEDESLLEPFARRVGSQLLIGGRLAKQTRRAMFSSSSGTFDGAEGVVIVRAEPDAKRPKAELQREEAYVRALVDGLQGFGTPVVGVERSDTDPSQVRWYRARDLPSVDNVDQPSGKASLVFALAGAADGAYGVKSTSDSMVPDALAERAG